jgi:hypothetical protein
MLQLDRAIFLVYRHDLKEVAVQAAVPASNFRSDYPIFLSSLIKSPRHKNLCRYLYSAFHRALIAPKSG